jgi:hypothetical protein
MKYKTFKYKKFIIFAGSYSDDSGGTVVLHQLCHLLNIYGYEAFLFPAFKTTIVHQEKWFKPILSILYASFKAKFLRLFKTLQELKTPIFNKSINNIDEEYVVIYAEGVTGNPLNAKNVVRWLLHKPGYNYKGVFFVNSELIFPYNPDYLIGFSLPFCKISNLRLYIPLSNLIFYTKFPGLPVEKRFGVAYCIRKGSGKALVHHDKDAILIDGLSHSATAEVFRRVKTFISYDSRTAYSVFASLCGADSIVIPDAGVSIDEWIPKELRYGLSYGFENIDWARSTRPNLMNMIQNDIRNTEKTIHSFVQEVNEYFPHSFHR